MRVVVCTKRGFSLIEMLAASMLLSAAVVVLCAVATRSMTGVRLNRQYETAWELLDRQLTMIDYMGVEEFLELRQMSGEFNVAGVSDADYRWQAVIEQGQTDSIYIVSMSISWGSDAKGGRISAGTILNGQEASESSDETVEQGNEAVS